MNPNNITFRQLRAFVTIAQTSSFAAAARRLHLTSSALSFLIRDLERNINARLFDRTTRSTTLSPAGSEFYPLARKVIEDLGHALQHTQDLKDLKRGAVRIACTPLYASAVVPELVMRYRERYPAVSVYILDSLNQMAVARVLSGEADLGIAPQRQSSSDLVQHSLLRDRIDFICRPDHPLAARQRVTWTEVLRQPFISLTPDFTARLQADLYKSSPHLTLGPAHEVSFITTALGMIQNGFGVSAQPNSCLPMLAAFELISRPLIAPVVRRELSIFHLSRRTLSAAAESFLAFLMQETAQRRH